MTTYSFYSHSAAPSPAPTETQSGVAGNNGMTFYSTVAGTINGIWQYSDSSFGTVTLPEEIYLYEKSTETLVASNTSPSWSGAAGSGWVYAAFSSPVSITANTVYMAAPGSLTTGSWFVDNETAGATALSNTPLFMEDDGQGWYQDSGAYGYPSSQLSGWSWYIDVTFEPSAENIDVDLDSSGPVTVTAYPVTPVADVLLQSSGASVTAYPLTPVTGLVVPLAVPVDNVTAYPLTPVYSARVDLEAAGISVTPEEPGIYIAPDVLVNLETAQVGISITPIGTTPPTFFTLPTAYASVAANTLGPPNPVTMSMVPQAFTDNYGNEIPAGFHLYGTGGGYMGFINDGDVAILDILPGGTYAELYQNGVIAGSVNDSGGSSEQHGVAIHSPQNSGKNAGQILLVDDAADGSSPASIGLGTVDSSGAYTQSMNVFAGSIETYAPLSVQDTLLVQSNAGEVYGEISSSGISLNGQLTVNGTSGEASVEATTGHFTGNLEVDGNLITSEVNGNSLPMETVSNPVLTSPTANETSMTAAINGIIDRLHSLGLIS